MAYGDFKDLSRRTDSDQILGDKVFNIVNIVQNMKHINADLLQWFVNFLIKKKQKVAGIESNNVLNQQLRKVCLSFEDNI